jgi:hypothetical protein
MAEQPWQGPLYSLSPEGAREARVEGSEGTLSRTEDGIEFSIETSGLLPGDGYTVWIMAFNNPEACQDPNAPPGFRCGMTDMQNPDAGFSLMYGGAGSFADSESVTFRGGKAKGDRSGVEFDGLGLTNPRGAEVHLRIRDHGPAQPGLEEDQIGTIGGGCTDESTPPGGSGARGTYHCRDVQATGM